MGDIIDVIALTAGQEVTVNRLWIGARVLPVKIMPDVLNKELRFIVIVPEVGLENFVMSSKSLVKLLHKTAVFHAPSFAKMEDIVRTQMMGQTAMNVFVALDLKEAMVWARLRQEWRGVDLGENQNGENQAA